MFFSFPFHGAELKIACFVFVLLDAEEWEFQCYAPCAPSFKNEFVTVWFICFNIIFS